MYKWVSSGRGSAIRFELRGSGLSRAEGIDRHMMNVVPVGRTVLALSFPVQRRHRGREPQQDSDAH
jgi:hypothetical protein